eukprot:scaffold32690_cov65-Phaeocystis_antarctica.AAC.2
MKKRHAGLRARQTAPAAATPPTAALPAVPRTNLQAGRRAAPPSAPLRARPALRAHVPPCPQARWQGTGRPPSCPAERGVLAALVCWGVKRNGPRMDVWQVWRATQGTSATTTADFGRGGGLRRAGRAPGVHHASLEDGSSHELTPAARDGRAHPQPSRSARHATRADASPRPQHGRPQHPRDAPRLRLRLHELPRLANPLSHEPQAPPAPPAPAHRLDPRTHVGYLSDLARLAPPSDQLQPLRRSAERRRRYPIRHALLEPPSHRRLGRTFREVVKVESWRAAPLLVAAVAAARAAELPERPGAAELRRQRV